MLNFLFNFRFFRFIIYLIIAVLVVIGINYWLTNKTYLFSEKRIEQIAKKYTGPSNSLSLEDSFKSIYNDLNKAYPGHILPKSEQQWIFMNAGGWMGSMCLLHASLSEYILLFGTALETSGHSGRYWLNVTDTILTGEFHQWSEGEFVAKIYKPGSTVKHIWGDVTGVNFKANTWMVEYGRGFIPSSLGFALADTIFSTQDFITFYYFVRMYAKAMFLEYAENIVTLFSNLYKS